MTFTPSQCVCGLYDGQTCSRQPCVRSKSIPSTPPLMNPVYTSPMHAGNIPWPYYPPTNPIPNQINYPIYMVPTGCICPPGANKECENPTCPRKPRPQLSPQI
jgi:hypothetical protein